MTRHIAGTDGGRGYRALPSSIERPENEERPPWVLAANRRQGRRMRRGGRYDHQGELFTNRFNAEYGEYVA